MHNSSRLISEFVLHLFHNARFSPFKSLIFDFECIFLVNVYFTNITRHIFVVKLIPEAFRVESVFPWAVQLTNRIYTYLECFIAYEALPPTLVKFRIVFDFKVIYSVYYCPFNNYIVSLPNTCWLYLLSFGLLLLNNCPNFVVLSFMFLVFDHKLFRLFWFWFREIFVR